MEECNSSSRNLSKEETLEDRLTNFLQEVKGNNYKPIDVDNEIISYAKLASPLKQTTLDYDCDISSMIKGSAKTIDEERDGYKKWLAELKKIKKFCRKNDGNKHIVVNKMIECILDTYNVKKTSQCYCSLVAMYGILCGIYNKHTFDALLQVVCGAGQTPSMLEKYCLAKIVAVIDRDETMCEQFFNYIKSHPVEFRLMHDLVENSKASKKMKNYIFKHNICFCNYNGKTTAISVDQEQNDIQFPYYSQGDLKGICIDVHGKDSSPFDSFCPKNVLCIRLPYLFGEDHGEKMEQALQKYKEILRKTFAKYLSQFSGQNTNQVKDESNEKICLMGTSNGNFMISRLSAFIADELDLDIDEVKFMKAPIHCLNEGIGKIASNMQDIKNKQRIKKIEVFSQRKGKYDGFLHPLRKSAQLARKLPKAGYSNVQLTDINSGNDYIIVDDCYALWFNEWVNNVKNISDTIYDDKSAKLLCGDKVLIITKQNQTSSSDTSATPCMCFGNEHNDNKQDQTNKEDVYEMKMCKFRDDYYNDKKIRNSKLNKWFVKDFERFPEPYLQYFNRIVVEKGGIFLNIGGKKWRYEKNRGNIYSLFPINGNVDDLINGNVNVKSLRGLPMCTSKEPKGADGLDEGKEEIKIDKYFDNLFNDNNKENNKENNEPREFFRSQNNVQKDEKNGQKDEKNGQRNVRIIFFEPTLQRKLLGDAIYNKFNPNNGHDGQHVDDDKKEREKRINDNTERPFHGSNVCVQNENSSNNEMLNKNSQNNMYSHREVNNNHVGLNTFS